MCEALWICPMLAGPDLFNAKRLLCAFGWRCGLNPCDLKGKNYMVTLFWKATSTQKLFVEVFVDVFIVELFLYG